MAQNGVPTDKIGNNVSLAKELIVNGESGTGRQAFASLATQLAGSGAVAQKLNYLDGRAFAEKEVYDTVAAGLAATPSGGQFQVKAADPATSAGKKYRNDNGAATLLSDPPSAGALVDKADKVALAQTDATIARAVSPINSPLVGLWIDLEKDASGRPVSGSTINGEQWVAAEGELKRKTAEAEIIANNTKLSRAVLAVSMPLVGLWLELTKDAANRVVSGTMLNGTNVRAEGGELVSDEEEAPALSASKYLYQHTTGTHFPDDPSVLTGIIVTGQSLAAAGTADLNGVITSVPEHPGFALMPNCGVRVDDESFDGFSDLYEQQESNRGETICSGMADAIMRRLQTDLGEKRPILFSVSALGGQAYYGDPDKVNGGLKRGSWTYTNVLSMVEQARNVAAMQGKRYVVAAVVIVHGEEDYKSGTSNAEYERVLHQWRMALEEDIRRITGQRELLRAYASQANRAQTINLGVDLRTPLATLRASDRDPHVVCLGPNYFATDGGDHAHPNQRGYRRMGEAFGDAIGRDLFGAYFTPLRIEKSYFVNPTTIRLEYDRQVAIDTSGNLVSTAGFDGAGYGIDFYDGSSSPPSITGLSTTGQSRMIDVSLSAEPVGYRPQIFVAARGTSMPAIGNQHGARSCIREATPFTTDPSDGTELYHWHCHDQVPVPYYRGA